MRRFDTEPVDDLSEEAVIDVCSRVTERRRGRGLEASHPLVEGIRHAGCRGDRGADADEVRRVPSG